MTAPDLTAFERHDRFLRLERGAMLTAARELAVAVTPLAEGWEYATLAAGSPLRVVRISDDSLTAQAQLGPDHGLTTVHVWAPDWSALRAEGE